MADHRHLCANAQMGETAGRLSAMDRARFRRLVQRALVSLPPEVRGALDNVALVIEREPAAEELRASGLGPRDTLYGLYVGTPRTERTGGGSLLPDRIVIFQGPLERSVHPRDIPAEVARTVQHELAHYFGVTEERMSELELD